MSSAEAVSEFRSHIRVKYCISGGCVGSISSVFTVVFSICIHMYVVLSV